MGNESKDENSFWSEGAYAETININEPNFKERMRHFEEKADEEKNLKCEKCEKAIGKHNLYWHEGMCNGCFFDTYNL